MPLHAQKKGKRGEVEFCEWLFDNLYIDVERNYNQADGHSSDVITDDFIFEVKRRESLDLDTWWHQVVIAKGSNKNKDLIPVVAYRQNRKKWHFLIPANLINGLDKGYLVANERVFLQYAKTIANEEKKYKIQGEVYTAGELHDIGLTCDGKKLFAECNSCEETFQVSCDPKDFDKCYSYCGRSERCIA